jgi:two-component system, cell cycle sensor histidine kinase and response regulator CckA
MESIGQLAGGVAHDFNNILTTVMGYSSSIKRSTEIPEKIRKRVEEIEKASQRGAEITRQLLTFSRKQPVRLEPVNLNEVIDQSILFLTRTLGPTIAIEKQLAPDLGIVKADMTQIQQILINLSVNSRDAMPEGGRIFIQTSNILLDQSYAENFAITKPGPHVLLSFTDTGHGMDKNTLNRAFEPFFTTKPVGKGTGLGLSIVYGIVKNHDGLVKIYSEVGRGTTFKIYLPIVQDREKTKVLEDTVIKGGRETVLVIDDEEMILNMAASLLEHFGYKCLTACNGVEGLEIYKTQGKKIDLVLLDIVMPRMSGPEVLREIMKINPGARVIMSSGFSIQSEKELLDNGVMAFVSKPYPTRILVQTIREVLDRKKENGFRGS